MGCTLTITIVVYHRYESAKETVASIEKFTSPEIKKMIFIIDNSCLDDDNKERQLFENSVTFYDDVVYINTKKNLGFGKGHNYVIDRLDSEFHAIVNPDIVLKEDSFSKIIEYMKNDYAGMCIPRIIDESGELQDAYRLEPTVTDMFIRVFAKNIFKKRMMRHSMKYMDYSKPFKVPFGQGSFLVIKTALWKQLCGFDKRYFMYLEDADLCKRVNAVSELMYFPDTEIIHKWQKGSHKNKRLFGIHIVSMIKYFNKWKWKLI